MSPSAGTVDVWRIPLDLPAAQRERLCACLDDGERRHAERMSSGGERWAMARAARREILSRCCEIAAESLRFDANLNGKPRLLGCPDVHFNMSSRDDVALLAISGVGHVGVDIERDDIPGDITEVARSFLPAAEFEAVMETPAKQRSRRFAIAWTRYEAVRKLWGLGIDEQPPEHDRERIATVREIDAPDGFVAALAAEGDDWAVRVRDATGVIEPN